MQDLTYGHGFWPQVVSSFFLPNNVSPFILWQRYDNETRQRNTTTKTRIVAGDSWGETSIPLAIQQPWTMFILFAIMMTISLGCMNLSPGRSQTKVFFFGFVKIGDFLWFFYGFSMVFLWFFYGFVIKLFFLAPKGVPKRRPRANLRILAVIVERATEARENDQQRKMQKKAETFVWNGTENGSSDPNIYGPVFYSFFWCM